MPRDAPVTSAVFITDTPVYRGINTVLSPGQSGQRRPPWTPTVTCGQTRTSPRRQSLTPSWTRRYGDLADSVPAEGARRDAPRPAAYEGLDVVVELELVRVRAQPELVQLGGPLVVQPRLDEVVGEHAALGQERVVRLQVVEHRVERAGDLRDGGRLVRGQLVQVP